MLHADQRISFCIVLILIAGLFSFHPLIQFHGGPDLNTRFGNEGDGGDDHGVVDVLLKQDNISFVYERHWSTLTIKYEDGNDEKKTRNGLMLLYRNQNTRTKCCHVTRFIVQCWLNRGYQYQNQN